MTKLLWIAALAACTNSSPTSPDGGPTGDGVAHADGAAPNPDAGKLVTSWGHGGVAVVSNGNAQSLTCLVEESTGRLFLAGSGNGGAFTGFAFQTINGDGSVPIEPLGAIRVGSQSGTVNDCTATANDEIYLAGTADAGYAIVQKFAGATIDTSFGAQGQVSTQLGAGIDVGSQGLAAVEQANGSVLLAGAYMPPGTVQTTSFYLYKFTATGEIDTTFGPAGDGRATADTGALAEAHAAITLGDGRIVAVGLVNTRVAAMRFSATGVRDSSFGTGGIQTTNVQVEQVAYAPATNQIVGLSNRFAKVTLVRTSSDGVLDPTFGTGGVLVPTVPATFFATDVLIQPDGKILVSGYGQNQTMPVVLRFLADGTPDLAFGTAGVAMLDVSSELSAASARRLRLARDGSLYVGGIGRTTMVGDAPHYFAAKVAL